MKTHVGKNQHRLPKEKTSATQAQTATDSPLSTAEAAPSAMSQSAPTIDISKLRLSQNFAAMTGVKKILATVPVKKPNRQEFIRVRPEPEWQFETAMLELKEDREHYLVSPDMWPELPGDLTPKLLLTAMNRQGVVFLWPIRLPGEDGRLDSWNQSALEASKLAMKHWVRVSANMGLGGYEVFLATGDIPEPAWPEISFDELVNIAFKGKMIASVDHPVIAMLRGLR